MNNFFSNSYVFSEFTHWLDFVVVVFFAAFVVQMIYFIGIFSRFAFYKSNEKTVSSFEPVSVVICAKNERENLLHLLPEFLSQDYPTFEIVVVNDNSVDDSDDVLKAYSFQYPNLKVVNVPDNDRFYGSKKFALTLGIKGAKYDNLLLTDADCKPASNQWLKQMSNYSEHKSIILGYGAYQKQSGLLNKLIRFETVFTAIQYFSFALCKMPYMGVGRNLAYQKEIFFKNRGFSSHQHILSGDDDLFVNEVADKYNTQIVVDSTAQTISIPKTSFKSWVRQKKRHLSTGKFYKFKHKFLLSLFPISYLIFIVSLIILLITQTLVIPVLSAIFLRILIQLIIFKKSINKLGEKDLMGWIPFFEVFFLFFQPILLISNAVKRNNRWN